MSVYRYKEYKADAGTITVPENRNKKNTRMIQLPVVRIYSKNKKPAEPVFLLFGGPGQSNNWARPPMWLLENHHLVMVGYRGVDGPVSLQIPEFNEVLKMKKPLSPSSLKKIGDITTSAFHRFKKEGIDIDGYNIVEVIDDIETVRKALGYGKINLYGASFGTRYAYVYGLRYPGSIHRRVMADVSTPGPHALDSSIMESCLNKLAELWKKDPRRAEQMPDPIKTIKRIMNELPPGWKGMDLDRDRLRLAVFHSLYHRKGMAVVFNAFAAAKKGDFGGLALLSNALERFARWPNWGEGLSKKISSEGTFQKPAGKQTTIKAAVMRSPYDQLWPLFADKWPIKRIPEKYRSLRPSKVETLMISGSIDISTPPEYAKELLPYLAKGHHVILAERGHMDVGRLQPEAYQLLVERFFLEGIVDNSKFKYIPMDF